MDSRDVGGEAGEAQVDGWLVGGGGVGLVGCGRGKGEDLWEVVGDCEGLHAWLGTLLVTEGGSFLRCMMSSGFLAHT